MEQHVNRIFIIYSVSVLHLDFETRQTALGGLAVELCRSIHIVRYLSGLLETLWVECAVVSEASVWTMRSGLAGTVQPCFGWRAFVVFLVRCFFKMECGTDLNHDESEVCSV